MINSRQETRYWFYIFCFIVIFLTVSCGPVEQADSTLASLPPTPSGEQPVEYGASLNEWEEATQAEDSASVDLAEAPELSTSSTAEQVTETLDGHPGFVAVENTTTEEPDTATLFTLDDTVYQEVFWDALVPADFTPEAIMAKYEDRLAQFEDDSAEASELYMQMQAEFNSSPVNEAMDGVLVRLPGFIAPLEFTDDLITEFLLVPYFGACIHVPPPPANQTVLVKMPEGEGIKFEDAWDPYWVMGELTAEGVTTDLAQAGYYIENAVFELYSEGP